MKTFSQYLVEMSVGHAKAIIAGLSPDVQTIGIMTPMNPEASRQEGE